MPVFKNCPYCSEQILSTAKKCKHCGEFMVKEEGQRYLKDSSPTHPKTGYGEFKKDASSALGCIIWGFVGTFILWWVYFAWEVSNSGY